MRVRSGDYGPGERILIGPASKIGDREAFEEWVGLDDLLSFGTAGGVGTGHNRGSIGTLQCRQDRHSSPATSKVRQIKRPGRYG